MKIADDITDLIGNTPLLRFKPDSLDLKADILLKIESSNPGRSIKDRIALGMINDAAKKGLLKKGGQIIEPTSGNTGIGLAMIAASRGYKLTIVMPDNMSIERIKLLEFFGATVILTPAANGMPGAIAKAEEMIAQTDGAIMLNQFDNPANPEFHYNTTGPEIWSDTDGKVDIFVAGVGTGGTTTGVTKFLLTKNPAVKSIAVEPKESPVISGGARGPHGIQGIGAGFVPKNLDVSLVDEIFQVATDDAIKTAKLAGKAGISAGISSGAALFAAVQVAQRQENKGKVIVVIIPDDALKYISTKLFDKE